MASKVSGSKMSGVSAANARLFRMAERAALLASVPF